MVNVSWQDAKATEFARSSEGGRPITARSTFCTASAEVTSARLPTSSFTFTFGCCLTNSSSTCGSRYSAVVTAPTRSVPAISPRCAAIASLASRHSASMRSA